MEHLALVFMATGVHIAGQFRAHGKVRKARRVTGEEGFVNE